MIRFKNSREVIRSRRRRKKEIIYIYINIYVYICIYIYIYMYDQADKFSYESKIPFRISWELVFPGKRASLGGG